MAGSAGRRGRNLCCAAVGLHNGVHVFMDNPNIWEEAKKYAAEQQNYYEKDYRVRFDNNKLLEIVQKDLQLRSATVYGSLSAEVAKTVFDQNWKTKMYPRSPIDNREKQVDGSMSVDITWTVMKEPGCKIVILSGDADFLPAIEAALNQNCVIEVWSFERALSNRIRKKRGVKVKRLEDIWREITFTQLHLKPEKARAQNKKILLTIYDFAKFKTAMNIWCSVPWQISRLDRLRSLVVFPNFSSIASLLGLLRSFSFCSVLPKFALQ